MNVTGSGRGHLDFRKCAVAAQNRERPVEIREVFLLCHEGEITRHKIGGEEGIASGAITLRRRRQIQTSSLKEIVFQVEASLVYLLIFMRQNRSQDERSHAGVQILAHFERD